MINKLINIELKQTNFKETNMYEYKVEVLGVREAEERMNQLAKDGWRVIEITPNIAMGHGIVVTFERAR